MGRGKRLAAIAIGAWIGCACSVNAFADELLVGYAPGEFAEVGGTAAGMEAAITIMGSADGTGSLSRLPENTAAVNAAPSGAAVSSSAPQTAVQTTVALSFKLVSPNVWRGNLQVAEGSVQLADGSWVSIPHSASLRAPFYRVLREETDSTGTVWYVCAAHASRHGDFHTPDGSVSEELWIKKSDCREVTSLALGTDNQTRIQIVKEALACLGKQYASAGSGPDAFDCSGLVNYVFAKAGVSVPRQSSAICAMSGQISADELRPGDIVGRPGHVGIYIGDGIFVHSSETETGVVAESMEIYSSAGGFTNYINAVGD